MKKLNVALWIVQVVLAALYVFAGLSKFLIPADQMQLPPSLSLGFIHFIGCCEVLGGIGLIVPAATRIKPFLTPLAACGLIIIMIGAVVLTAQQSVAGAVMPFVCLCLAAFVAYGRFQLAPRLAR